MKTLYLKQKWTSKGPWKSFDYKDMSTRDILSSQIAKAANPFEMILLLEADVRVINCYIPPPYLAKEMTRLEYRKALDEYTSNVVEAPSLFTKENKVWDECDVVITEDAFLTNIEYLKSEWPDKLYCTFRGEHGDSLESEKFYDLHLDHALGYGDSSQRIKDILTVDFEGVDKATWDSRDKGYSIYYPYSRSPEKIREAFDCKTKTHINFEYRTVTFLNTGFDNGIYKDEYYNKIDEVANELNMKTTKVSEKVKEPFMVTYPMESDSLEYYESLAKSKYYISVSNRLGQGLVEAVSCNAISIGHKSSPNHRLLCHPKCLFEKPIELITEDTIITLLKEIEASEELQKEILEYQNIMINRYFVEYPKQILKHYLKLKRGE